MNDYGFAGSLTVGIVIFLEIVALAFIYLTVRGIVAAGEPVTPGHVLGLASILIFLAVITGIMIVAMFGDLGLYPD